MKQSLRKISRAVRSLLWDHLEKERDMRLAANICTDSVQAVCLMLGPYRNLTTLTASVLYLHPCCQVLNHAGLRIFGDDRIDFLADFNEDRFQQFLQYSLQACERGRRGSYGGSIRHSHAVAERTEIRDAVARVAPKEQVTCLLWKESLRTSNHIRQCRSDLADMLARNGALRFMMPVRNPLDCAVSNIHKGHVRHFEGLNKNTNAETTLAAILDEFHWFRNLQKQFPERFFHFFAYDEPVRILRGVATFLHIEPSKSWLESGSLAFQVTSQYEHATELVSRYRKMVEVKFDGDPEFADGLLEFVDNP